MRYERDFLNTGEALCVGNCVRCKASYFFSLKASEDRTPMGIGGLSFFVLFFNGRTFGERGEAEDEVVAGKYG